MDRIKRFSGVLVVVLILSATEGRAAWMDNFDSYATGTSLHGQGGWKGWDNDSTWTAPTSGAQFFSAPNSAQIGGSADLVHEYSDVGGQVQFSTMQFIPRDGAAGQSYFILMNEYADLVGPYDWSVQLNFDMDAGQVVSDFGGGATASIVWDQWVPLLFDIDLDANTVDEYYNGSLLASHQWDDDGSNTFAAVDLFGNGASPIFYDGPAGPGGEVVPEPASIVLAAFGLLGLGLLGWRRRRRAA